MVELLATRGIGFTRKEISEKLGISNGSALTEILTSLMVSDFIISYIPFGEGKRDEKYKIIDPFCLFYLKFVIDSECLNSEFWSSNVTSPRITIWRGFAFENVCFNHIDSIKKALGISGVSTKYSAWSKNDDDGEGLQIDLIIERKDNIVNMCEIKFYSDEFEVNKKYDLTLRNRRAILSNYIPKKSAIHSTLITTYGVKNNEYKWDFENVITMDDLF